MFYYGNKLFLILFHNKTHFVTNRKNTIVLLENYVIHFSHIHIYYSVCAIYAVIPHLSDKLLHCYYFLARLHLKLHNIDLKYN